MSYLIFNEGWKKYAHVGVKNGLSNGILGLPGMVIGNTNNRVGNAYNSFMDGKFFDDHFKIGSKLNDMIYNWCSKLAKPISKSDANLYKNLDRFLPHKAFSTKFHIIKKIWGNNDKFYFVAFSFDDEKILELNLLKMLNPDEVKLVKLPQWNNIDPGEYKE